MRVVISPKTESQQNLFAYAYSEKEAVIECKNVVEMIINYQLEQITEYWTNFFKPLLSPYLPANLPVRCQSCRCALSPNAIGLGAG